MAHPENQYFPAMGTTPFDSFYHRHTAPWQRRRHLAIALAGAMALGTAILAVAIVAGA
jgi:hypothetical protein